MTAPAEFRSTVGAVKTNVPGIEIGGVFPKMARVADKMAFVRSFAHGNSGHGGGTHWVMTGYDFPPADNGGRRSSPASAPSSPATAAPTTPPPACRPTSAWAASSATARPGSARPTRRSTPAATPATT